MRTHETAARIGALAVVSRALTLAVMHALQPGLDATRHYVSE